MKKFIGYLTFLLLLPLIAACQTPDRAKNPSCAPIPQSIEESTPIEGREEASFSGEPTVVHGFVWNPQTGQNDLVQLELETGDTACVGSVSGLAGTPAAVSGDGRFFAYSMKQADDLTAPVSLVAENREDGTKQMFFTEEKEFQWVESLVFLPDSHTLLANITKGQQWRDTRLYCIDLDSGKIVLLDEASFPEAGEETHDAFDSSFKKYSGGRSLLPEENTGYRYVNFSVPVAAPDQKAVYYAATLNRSATPAFREGAGTRPLLWLCSGIWKAELDGGKPPQLIFALPDLRTRIGRLVLSPDGGRIAFSQIGADDRGTEGWSDLCVLDLEDGRIEKRLCHTENNELFYPRAWGRDGTLYLFCAFSQTGTTGAAGLHTEETKPVFLSYSYAGEPITLETMFPS